VRDRQRELLRLRHKQGRGIADEPLGDDVGWRGSSVQVKMAREYVEGYICGEEKGRDVYFRYV
jgi:hypothetical protein